MNPRKDMRYRGFIGPALELTGCMNYLKDIGKSRDEFANLVVKRMAAIDEMHRTHFISSRRGMIHEGVWDENFSSIFDEVISYEEALALAAVQIEIVAQVAEMYDDHNLRSDLMYLMGDISSCYTQEYIAQGLRAAQRLLYGSEDDEEWEE